MKRWSLLLALGFLLGFAGDVLARHVAHPVTPQNIDQQSFAFTVQVSDVSPPARRQEPGSAPAEGALQEITITVKRKPGNRAPVASASGTVHVDPCGDNKAYVPRLTRVLENGVQTYSFRVPQADLGRTHFKFTESPDSLTTPFPSPGDYWQVNPRDFAPKAKK
jgi:hypothetical protein